MLNFELVCEEIRQILKFCSEQSLLYTSKPMYTTKLEEIHFVESVIRVGDDFWAHPAKLTRRGCTAFVRFWQGYQYYEKGAIYFY